MIGRKIYATWEDVRPYKKLILKEMGSYLEGDRGCNIEINNRNMPLQAVMREVSEETKIGKAVALIWANTPKTIDRVYAEICKFN